MSHISHDKFLTDLQNIQESLLAFARTLVPTHDEACDLLQDTSLKAMDNRDKFSSNDNFKGWIFTIMRNIFINNYRHTSRGNAIFGTLDSPSLLNLPGNTVNEPEGTLAEREIHNAISQLDEDLCKPFSMHIAGYKYIEISEKLGIPMGTVKSRIFSARQILSKKFENSY